MSNIGKNLKTVAVMLLMSVLIVSFAITGVGANIFITSAKVMATVGKTEVESADVQSQVQREVQRYQTEFGIAMSAPELIRTFGLHNQVLQQNIGSATFAEAARLLELRGSDNQMAEYLRSEEAFQLLGGRFNPQQMVQVLRNLNMTYDKFERDMKQDFASRQLTDSLIANKVTPKVYADALYAYRNEMRKANVLSLPQSLIKDLPEPEEGDLEKYYEARKTHYMQPEQRNYSYLLIDPATFEKDVLVNEVDLQTEYDIRKAQYVTPELRELMQVSFETKEEAEDFIEKVNEGEDFVELAVSLTEFQEDEINLGELTRENIENDFNAETAIAVFALELDELSPPLEGFAGFSVFQTINIEEGSERTFAQVRPELEKELRDTQAMDLMFEYLTTVEDAIADYDTLDEVATVLNRDIAVLSGVRADGTIADSTGQVDSEVGRAILAAAFDSVEFDLLEVKDFNDSSGKTMSYVVQVTEVVEAVQKEFEEVVDEVKSEWQTAEQRLMLGDLAENVLARIKAGEEMEAVMNEVGGTMLSLNNIRRDDTTNSNVAPQLRSLIFSLEDGDSDIGNAADGNGYIIATVTGVIPATHEGNEAVRDVVITQLENAMANELLIQYQTHLQSTLDIWVNDPLFNQMFNNTNTSPFQ